MAPPKLTYFALKGLGEPIRFILSYAGEEFIDERIDYKNRNEWSSMKPKTPYGKLPIIEIDGKVVAQSSAICRYYAKKTGLAGGDDFEAMLIDATVDAFGDLRTAVSNYSYDPDETSKAKKYDVLVKETVPFYLERFEKQVRDNHGYFVGGKLSWADLYFVPIMEFMSAILKFDLLEKYPNLKAMRSKVLALPAIKAWVAKRPDSEF